MKGELYYVLSIGIITTLTGCQGHQAATVSGVGLVVTPGAVAAGSYVYQTTNPKESDGDGNPVLSRTEARAPGVEHRVTQAHGPVGDEIQKGGETLARIVEAMHAERNVNWIPRNPSSETPPPTDE